ncbi:hypothetical protein [Streptosporangium sandarakinum]|uniref:hypothetical protein n=1 Tax=Streptosporangium sandarakinum TaxID=1260955 RepID=UPI0033B20508
MERLREVPAHRRSGLGLREVAEPVGDPFTDAVAHLRRLRGLLLERRDRADAMSVWTKVGPEAEQRAVRGLSDDLDSGRWAERNRDLAGLDAADLGLRLLIA